MGADSQLPTHPQVDVLVVDDHRDSADSLGLLLSAKGYAVECAYGGVSALESILKFRPTLVVTDLAMPGFDGVTVAASVNRMALETRPTFIAYSAHVNSPNVYRASTECGIEDVLLKPDDLELLCTRIADILSPQRT